MQPKTNVTFDNATFDRIKRTIRNMSNTSKRRIKDVSYATELPDEVGIQLTNKCNLRCSHCFQWNEDGFLNNLSKEKQSEDIGIDIVEKIFFQTRKVKSNLYLWGGEPLAYKWWDDLAKMLSVDPRWSVLCTNGILIDKKVDSIISASESLAILFSLDGFEEENDNIRGKGTFKKVVENIDLLLSLKKQGVFKGEVSVNCVVGREMANKLYNFLEFFEAKGVNTVYFCLPWYLKQNTSENMDIYFKEKFGWITPISEGQIPSWHSYKYRLPVDILPVLMPQLKKVNMRTWNIRVRYQPALELDEVEDFILGKEIPAQKRKSCLALGNRMNVLPSGEVTMCKLFPEFNVGDLKYEDVHTLWHNAKITRCRQIVGNELMPVCSKCVLLYLHGI